MGKVIIGMTISLDGFVQDRDGKTSRLYPDLQTLRNTEMLQESIKSTGAVVMGKGAYAMAKDPDWFVGDYEYQVPIFVLTHARLKNFLNKTNASRLPLSLTELKAQLKRQKSPPALKM